MSCWTFEELCMHLGHDMTLVTYPADESVYLECNDCYEVILELGGDKTINII
jgi:hypothetical protein